MSILELMEQRFSVRSFKDTPIEDEKLSKILRAGQVAPTACNFQCPRVYVVKSAEAMEKMKKCSNSIYGAPMVLLICADINQAWKSPRERGYNTGEMDASIVCTHMMLEAWELGVGSVWVRAMDIDLLRELFELPPNIQPICLLPIGYMSDTCQPAPMHSAVKDIDELFIEV